MDLLDHRSLNLQVCKILPTSFPKHLSQIRLSPANYMSPRFALPGVVVSLLKIIALKKRLSWQHSSWASWGCCERQTFYNWISGMLKKVQIRAKGSCPSFPTKGYVLTRTQDFCQVGWWFLPKALFAFLWLLIRSSFHGFISHLDFFLLEMFV